MARVQHIGEHIEASQRGGDVGGVAAQANAPGQAALYRCAVQRGGGGRVADQRQRKRRVAHRADEIEQRGVQLGEVERAEVAHAQWAVGGALRRRWQIVEAARTEHHAEVRLRILGQRSERRMAQRAGRGEQKTVRRAHEGGQQLGRVQAGDMTPHHQSHGRQRAGAQPAGDHRVMPPFELHEIGGLHQRVERFGRRGAHQGAAAGLDMRGELRLFGRFETGDGVFDAVAPAGRGLDQARQHLAHAAAQMRGDVEQFHRAATTGMRTLGRPSDSFSSRSAA